MLKVYTPVSVQKQNTGGLTEGNIFGGNINEY